MSEDHDWEPRHLDQQARLLVDQYMAGVIPQEAFVRVLKHVLAEPGTQLKLWWMDALEA